MNEPSERVRRVLRLAERIRASAARIKRLHDEIERMNQMDSAQLSSLLRDRRGEGPTDG